MSVLLADIPHKFPNLRGLNLSYNKLTVLPQEICCLKSLEVLNLEGNQLTTLPPEIAQLSHLRKITLWDNELKSLPIQAILQCTQLEEFAIENTLAKAKQLSALRAVLVPMAFHVCNMFPVTFIEEQLGYKVVGDNTVWK